MTIKGHKPVLAFFTFILGITSTSSAYYFKVPNEDGIDLYYSWNKDKTELAISNIRVDLSKVESGRIVIPAYVSYQNKMYPVTSFWQGAFSFCSELKSIVIPNSVTSINCGVFSSCHNLTDIVIPNSIKSIGDFAFDFCESLTSFTIPDSVTSIGEFAFAYCSNLTSMTISESVVSIGQGAFREDYGLTSIRIYCKDIGSWFAGLYNIKDVVIGDKVKSIGKSAFCNLKHLKGITIPASVASIGECAFSGCTNLKKLVIEGNPVIYDEAFAWCENIDSIVFKSQTPPEMICSTFDNHTFTDYTYKHAVLSVPEGAYDAYATSDVWSRFSVICTHSEEEYESDFESDSIYYTFQDDGVYVAAKKARGRNDYSGDGPLTPRDPTAGGQQPRTRSWTQGRETDSLDYMPYHGNIVIPESVSVFDTTYTVTGIKYLAFQGCNELESVTIPNSVKQIGYAGFAECTGLTEITIPAGVELIDKYAFAYCSNLKRVVIEGNPVIDETAFLGCGTELEVIMAREKGFEEMDPYTFTYESVHYDIYGHKIQADTPGLHLIKRKDGSVVKTLNWY